MSFFFLSFLPITPEWILNLIENRSLNTIPITSTNILLTRYLMRSLPILLVSTVQAFALVVKTGSDQTVT